MRSIVLFDKRPLVTQEAARLIAFGDERRWTFEVMPQKGVLEDPITESNFIYDDLRKDSTILPSEAVLILKEVVEVSPVPIKQFIIGHEIQEQKQEPKRNPVEIPWDGVAKVVATIALGMLMIPFYVLAFLLSGADPCLIAVLDDSDDGRESWVCLARWEE